MNLKIFFCVCVQGDNEVNKRPCLLPTSQVCLLSAFSCSNHLAPPYSFTSKHCWRISVNPTAHPFQKLSLWILANIYLHYEPKPPLCWGCGSLSILLVSEFIPHFWPRFSLLSPPAPLTIAPGYLQGSHVQSEAAFPPWAEPVSFQNNCLSLKIASNQIQISPQIQYTITLDIV